MEKKDLDIKSITSIKEHPVDKMTAFKVVLGDSEKPKNVMIITENGIII